METINAGDDVLTAQASIATGNPLAFDDCVWVVLAEADDIDPQNRNIDSPVWYEYFRPRTGFGSGRNCH
ncbi:MAG: hypothetical protein OXG98_03070 [Gemmatimonadetes bacterium]|nr:hypothetical protein [Gemmatimonadota bacterium]